jgi:hypothetical protein
MENKFKKRDPIAKDLRTPKYRMRVVVLKTAYSRKNKHKGKHNALLEKEKNSNS